MKILITGAAGFIGSFLSRQLLLKGHDVVGIDNFDPYYDKRVKLLNLDIINFLQSNSKYSIDTSTVESITEILELERLDRVGEFTFKEIDIRSRGGINGLMEREGFDSVIHLAAQAGVPASLVNAYGYTDVNVLGSMNILDLSVKNKIKNFIFASSSSVYGDSMDEKFSEDSNVDQPISPYAATKRMSEIMHYTYSQLHDINIVNIRIFTAYGPMQRPYGMAMQKFIKQAYFDKDITVYGDGSMERDYTYIDDLIDGFVSIIENTPKYLTVNLGNDSPVSVRYLAELIQAKVGQGRVVNIEKPVTEVRRTAADITLARERFGFSPDVQVEDGIQKQIEVFSVLPDWYKGLEG